MNTPGCAETLGLGQGQIAAFQFYGKLQLKSMQQEPTCPWLLVEPKSDLSVPKEVDLTLWQLQHILHHAANAGESVLLFKQRPQTAKDFKLQVPDEHAVLENE